MILFHPESVTPNLPDLIQFALSGALVVTSEEETIAAILQEVEPVAALETAINLLDEKPKTGFFAIQFIILALELNQTTQLERMYVARACSFCLHQAKTPEEQRLATHLFQIFGSMMPDQYTAFVQTQPMQYTQHLGTFIRRQPQTQNQSQSQSSLSESQRSSGRERKSRITPKNAMDVVTEELSKRGKCDLQRLDAALEFVKFTNKNHLDMVFQRFLVVLSNLETDEVTLHKDTIRSICRRKFRDPGLLAFLSNKPPSELIRGLSVVSFLAPTSLFKGASLYAQALYYSFTKSNGTDRRAIALLFVALNKIDNYDIRKCGFVSKQHLRVLEALMSEFEDL